jgi:hypothetical protein
MLQWVSQAAPFGDQMTNPHVLSSVLWRAVLSFKLTFTRLLVRFDANNFY